MHTQLVILVIPTLFLSACAADQVCREFDANDISVVELRALNAPKATLLQSKNEKTIKVCGIPGGGAKGYHSPDKSWKETSASEWGLDFEAKPYGKVLVISTRNEIRYIHHYYYFETLSVEAPTQIVVKPKARILSGEGNAELDEPKEF